MAMRVLCPAWALALLLLPLPLAAAYPSYHELYYEQTLDHFSPSSRARWQHRYLLNNESWGKQYLLNNESWGKQGPLPGGCRGPVLLYTGNEGDIEGFWASNGFMIEVLAPRLGALLLFPEQRFYGKSLPFGADSQRPEHLQLLTTSQVLEDYAELVYHLRATLPGASGCPVVAFGGSYGGTLAALLRASHPTAVAGALAASSELGYYDVAGWAAHGVDEYAFEDIVATDYGAASPRCLGAIRAAADAIDDAREEDVLRAFNVCEAKALGTTRRSDLFTYALEALPQQDYPYAIGGMPPLPVSRVCERLTAASGAAALLEAAVSVTRLGLGVAAGACIPTQSVGGPGNTPGDGPGPGSWGWQSCTETLHSFSARAIRNYTFDLSRSTSLCTKLYGGAATPDLSLLARRFGGYALAEGTAGVTNLIWSQGTLDPWHGWFRKMRAPPAGSGVHHFLMRGSAHHLDLRGPHPADPPDVTAARARATEIIEGWVGRGPAAGRRQEVVV